MRGLTVICINILIHNKNVQNVIKYTTTKLYNPDIYNQSMFIQPVTNL